jgi:hypothetical protein
MWIYWHIIWYLLREHSVKWGKHTHNIIKKWFPSKSEDENISKKNSHQFKNQSNVVLFIEGVISPIFFSRFWGKYFNSAKYAPTLKDGKYYEKKVKSDLLCFS